jgi:hypothetical protein
MSSGYIQLPGYRYPIEARFSPSQIDLSTGEPIVRARDGYWVWGRGCTQPGGGIMPSWGFVKNGSTNGVGATAPDASTTPVAQSAATLLAALQAQGCTVPTNTVEIFQNDWNDAQPDSQLTASGVYDAPTATALQQILTAAGNTTTVPAACAAITAPTTTLTSPAAPVDYTAPVLIVATAVAVGLVAWGWHAGRRVPTRSRRLARA